MSNTVKIRFSKVKIILLSFVLLFIVFAGCGNDTVTPSNTTTTSYYELPVGRDSSITYYYGVEITQNSTAADNNGGAITGIAEIIDSLGKYSGTINGTMNGDSVSLNADFSNDKYDFGFKGLKSGDIIGGSFHFVNPVISPVDTFSVGLLKTASKFLTFDTTAPNAYIFQTIFTTPNPTGPPVIFIHGMGGQISNWDSIFTQLDAGFKSRHNVYAFQYNWQDSIMINGRILKDSVTAKGLINPIIVGHSMGGLVSRAYIASGGQITKLVTLGTPHLGSPLANYLPYISGSMNTPGPINMSVGGRFIADLLINPLDIANRHKYYCFAGEMGGHFKTTSPYWVWNETYYKDVRNGLVCKTWPMLLPYGKNDGLVNKWSAFFEGSNVNLPYPTPQYYVDHMHLVVPGTAPVIFNYINGL